MSLIRDWRPRMSPPNMPMMSPPARAIGTRGHGAPLLPESRGTVAGGRVTVGESVALRYRLRDPASGEPLRGLRDVAVMVYTSGHWKQRLGAVEVAAGVYEVRFVPTEATSYSVAIESPSRRLAFHHSEPLRLTAEPVPASR